MMIRLLAVAALFNVATACAAAAGGANSPKRGDRYVISREELAAHPASNMRDVINSLRPDWFRGPRTGSGLGGSASALPFVYLDGRTLGDIDSLRSVIPEAVERACYHNLSSAQNRFGSAVRTPIVELVSLGRNPNWNSC